MSRNPDMTCSECDDEFQSASELLKHYALHVKKKTKILPDLYPIVPKNKPLDGYDDEPNPMNFCLVTMDDDTTKKSPRKYQCPHCSRIFGWPTDLKRHILVHTGEKPFKCRICDVSFTRKFLLERHLKAKHAVSKKCIPNLRPIRQDEVASQISAGSDENKSVGSFEKTILVCKVNVICSS